MVGGEPTKTRWRRPIVLAAALGLIAGVVIGGAGHSLPGSSTRPMSRDAALLGAPRTTITVRAAAPTVTVLQTVTVSVPARPGAPPVAGSAPGRIPPASSAAADSTHPGNSTHPGKPSAPRSSPAPGPKPLALCKDGTLSYAAHHQGACSHHGGAARWYR